MGTLNGPLCPHPPRVLPATRRHRVLDIDLLTGRLPSIPEALATLTNANELQPRVSGPPILMTVFVWASVWKHVSCDNFVTHANAGRRLPPTPHHLQQPHPSQPHPVQHHHPPLMPLELVPRLQQYLYPQRVQTLCHCRQKKPGSRYVLCSQHYQVAPCASHSKQSAPSWRPPKQNSESPQ